MSEFRYEQTNKAFEKAITLLRENLQYLADHDKVSSKFIALQNGVIKALINYQQQTERILSALEWENTELAIGKSKEYQQLLDIKEAFEAVCIIHGIMDFPIWMNKGKKLLVEEAVEFYHSRTIQLPSRLREWIDKLPEAEQATFKKILYSGYQREAAEMQKRIQKLQEKETHART